MKIDNFNTWLREDNRKTLIMGILNVTPDSFSDGGKYGNAQQAVDFALKMEEDGADIIDIGGESTRPGAKPVDFEEELNRVIPVIEGIRKKSDIVISIDTYKSNIAEKAIIAGANIINDISGYEYDYFNFVLDNENPSGTEYPSTDGEHGFFILATSDAINLNPAADTQAHQ